MIDIKLMYQDTIVEVPVLANGKPMPPIRFKLAKILAKTKAAGAVEVTADAQ